MRLPHYCQRLPQQYHRLYHCYRSIPYLSYNYTKILLSDRLPRIELVTPTCEDYAVVLLLPHRDDIAQFKFPASDIGLTFKSVFKRWTCLFNLDCFQLTGSQPRSFGQLSVKNMSTQVPWSRLSPGPLTRFSTGPLIKAQLSRYQPRSFGRQSMGGEPCLWQGSFGYLYQYSRTIQNYLRTNQPARFDQPVN